MTYIIGSLLQRLANQGKCFTFVTGFTVVAGTAETDFVLIRNPSGSGKKVSLSEFLMTIDSATAQRSIFKFYRNPTITNVGTPITLFKVNPNGAISPTVLAYSSPTISNRGSLIQGFRVDNVTYGRNQKLSRFLVEGADLLITVQGSTNNIEHNLTAVWAET